MLSGTKRKEAAKNSWVRGTRVHWRGRADKGVYVLAVRTRVCAGIT